MDSTFNGWLNWFTWNVALWIGNDEFLYDIAKECAHRSIHPYGEFVDQMLIYGIKETPDGCPFSHPDISRDEMNEMMEELIA